MPNYDDINTSQRAALERLHNASLEIERTHAKIENRLYSVEQLQKKVESLTYTINDQLSEIEDRLENNLQNLRNRQNNLIIQSENSLTEHENKLEDLYQLHESKYMYFSHQLDSINSNTTRIQESYQDKIEKINNTSIANEKLFEQKIAEQEQKNNALFLKNNQQYKEHQELFDTLLSTTKLLEESYQNQLKDISKQINNLRSIASPKALSELEEQSNQIISFHQSLFLSKNDRTSINNALTEIQTQYQNLFISNAENQESKISQLTNFHKKIFGSEASGLPSLDEKLTVQLEKFHDVEKEAKSVIQLSSDAGLAGGFFTKGQEAKEGKKNSLYFFITLLIIIVVLNKFLFNIEDFNTIKWENLLFKLTLNAPFIWLATVANINLNRYSRLEQEYAHKESLARSFERYKTAIQDLKDISKEESAKLQLKLMEVCLDAFKINPAESSEKAKSDLDLLDFIKTQFTSKKQSD